MSQVFRPFDRQVVELAHVHARQRGAVARLPAPSLDACANPRQASLKSRVKRSGACPRWGVHAVDGGLSHEAGWFRAKDGAWPFPATDVAYARRGLYRFLGSPGASLFRMFPAGCVA